MSKKTRDKTKTFTPLRQALKGVNIPLGDFVKLEEEGRVYIISVFTEDIGNEEAERMRRRMKANTLRQRRGKIDEKELARHFAQFGEEDRQLAEMGMADYTAGLIKADKE